MAVPGFFVKIHNSLTTPILMMGVPRNFFILNATLGAAIIFGLQSLYGIPIVIILHVLAVILAKKDPYFFQALLRHIKQKSYYDV